jgi:radical SAM protein with 4Fe4S-binding SPASM domain
VSGYVRRVPARGRVPAGRLAALDVELTERCDNECIHCSVALARGDRGARARELGAERWKAVLEQAADLGCPEVRFTGGEPLLRRDFEELYLHARRLGMAVRLSTNARGFGRGNGRGGGRGARLAALLARTPPLAPVEVTAYGMHAASYEAVTRAPGSFAQYRRGLERLLGHGVEVQVKGVVLPPTRAELAEFEAWAAQLAAPPRRAATAPEVLLQLDLRARRDDAARNDEIRRLRLPPEEVARLLAREPEAFRAARASFAARFLGPPGPVLFRCGVGRRLAVDPYGGAHPCLGLHAPLTTVDLTAAGGAAAALERLAALGDLEAEDPEYLRRCARCFLHGLCEQCPSASWSEHGTLDTPVEYHCEVTHAQARLLGWLGRGESAWDVENWTKRAR